MAARVTIGVPVYRGEAFLEETLRSIRNQTCRDFEVAISLDGPDPACEAICQEFLSDSRFRMTVQPSRLGWVGNLNWLQSRAETDFWLYHQQDDLAEPEYLEALLDHALENPDAALVYCDMVPFGRIEAPFAQPESIRGSTACARMLVMLREHFPAFAFRGLTRAGALREAGGVPPNGEENFGSDICWIAGVARAGEILHLPRPLYRKRYHASNTESQWWEWPMERRLSVWSAHCVHMFERAMRIRASVQERRLLWAASVERLTSPQAAGHFLRVFDLTGADRRSLLEEFLSRAKACRRLDVPALLDSPWRRIARWTRDFFWLPAPAAVEIHDFGPARVVSGARFNVQPDGSSTIWVRISDSPEPGLHLRLDGVPLETVAAEGLLTAAVPPSLTDSPGRKALLVVGPDGHARSRPIDFEIVRE